MRQLISIFDTIDMGKDLCFTTRRWDNERYLVSLQKKKNVYSLYIFKWDRLSSNLV